MATMYEFPDFQQHAPMPESTIEAYRDRVPADLIAFWQHYGTGSFIDDYLRVIDPAVYEPALVDCTGRVSNRSTESIPIMVTGLGDLLTWEPGAGFTLIMFRVEDIRGMGTKFDTLIGLLELDGTEDLDERWDWDMFPKARAAHGPLPFDESFISVPLLSLGGPKTAENLQPRKTIEAIRMMVEMQGLIEH